MGKKLGLVAISALMLTGCAAGEPKAAPTLTTAAAPEATPDAALGVTADNVEDVFLQLATTNWRGDIMPSDSQLIEYGEQVCEVQRAGEMPPLVLPGSTQADMVDSVAIISAAQQTLCPEFL